MGREDGRDVTSRSERRCNDLAQELDELKMAYEQIERARKLAENERSENADRVHELQAQCQSLQNAKRKTEGEFHSMQEEIEELENEARAAEDRANKALAEVARIQAELAQAAGGKNLKNQIRKLEQRCRDLEASLDDEARKSADVVKNQRRSEKKFKDLQFQMEEDHKNAER